MKMKGCASFFDEMKDGPLSHHVSVDDARRSFLRSLKVAALETVLG